MQHLFLKKEPGGKGEDDDDVRMFIKPKKKIRMWTGLSLMRMTCEVRP